MTIYKDYLEIKKRITELEEKKFEMEREIYSKFKKEIDKCPKDTYTTVDGDFMIKIVSRTNVSVDQDKAASIGGLGMRAKFEIDKRTYDKLNAADKEIVDACLTSKPGKPSFLIIEGESLDGN